jgi:RNA polymerase sigma factor (sigma-70 family)
MLNTPGNRPLEMEYLAAARLGDAQSFSELTEPFRRELQVHCYRILGSLHEAEDMVQETMLRAWKRLETYEGRASFRAWLYKIATHACLDLLDRRRFIAQGYPYHRAIIDRKSIRTMSKCNRCLTCF